MSSYTESKLLNLLAEIKVMKKPHEKNAEKTLKYFTRAIVPNSRLLSLSPFFLLNYLYNKYIFFTSFDVYAASTINKK